MRNDLAQPCRELCLCCCQPGYDSAVWVFRIFNIIEQYDLFVADNSPFCCFVQRIYYVYICLPFCKMANAKFVSLFILVLRLGLFRTFELNLT